MMSRDNTRCECCCLGEETIWHVKTSAAYVSLTPHRWTGLVSCGDRGLLAGIRADQLRGQRQISP